MDPVNGIVPADQSSPLRHGTVRTADFEVIGDVAKAYQHLKEMFDPPKHSESGPIKPMSEAEKQREKNKPLEDAVSEIPPTVSP